MTLPFIADPHFPRRFLRALGVWLVMVATHAVHAQAPDVERHGGIVRQYLLDEFGDVEGVIAVDGTPVAFPPHMGPDLVRALAPGDRFVAQGRGTGGRGFRAYAIGKEGATPLVEARPSVATRPLPREARAASLVPLQVDGVVAGFLFAPRGEVDGVVLDDGTIVRVPPRSGIVDPASSPIGAKLSARGYGTRNAYGTALRAEAIGVNGQPMETLQPQGPTTPRPPRPPSPPSPHSPP